MPAVRVSRTTSSSTPPVSRSAAASCARGSNLLQELLEWGRSFKDRPPFFVFAGPLGHHTAPCLVDKPSPAWYKPGNATVCPSRDGLPPSHLPRRRSPPA